MLTYHLLALEANWLEGFEWTWQNILILLAALVVAVILVRVLKSVIKIVFSLVIILAVLAAAYYFFIL